MISNCGHDERWLYRGGVAGDNTGSEWQIIPWYYRPWNVMLRYPDPEVRHWMGNQAVASAVNDNIGYDQGQRTTFWEQLVVNGYDAAKINTPCETDCSSGVLSIAKAAGYHFNIEALKNIDHNGWTGTQEEIMVAAGFEVHTEPMYLTTDKYLDNGDVLLNKQYHTAFNITRGELCDANDIAVERKTVEELAKEVWEGKWGDNPERARRLVAAGYDAQAVQDAVNAMARPAEKTVEKTVAKVTVRTGAALVIDVSEHQKQIDWDRVKPQIDGVIVRCGYGSDEASQDDKWWVRNISEVERLSIPYGVYLYSYADSTAKIQSEINHALRLIKGREPVLGVFYDLEESSKGWIAKQAAKTWCQKIREAGYTPGIYCGGSFFKRYLSGVQNSVDALWWIAAYGLNTGVPQPAYKPDLGFEYDAWQYTSVRRFNGINTGVDTSEWYADYKTVTYQAHCQTYGWMKEKRNGEWAGTTGEGKRLEALLIDPPLGVELEVTAHIQTYGDRKYTISHGNTTVIGTTGERKRMEGISIRMLKNPDNLKLYYQGHCQTYGDTEVCGEGEFCGTKGQSKRMEAFRMEFVS